MIEYLKDPAQIEKNSFELIREQTDLSAFDVDQQQIVMRLVHTCGNPDIAKQVRISDNAVISGITALNNQQTILCDVEMVKKGLTRRYLDNDVHCFLNQDGIADLAKKNSETRTMTALEYWTPYLQNSIVLIGNAPTALFRLLEMLEAGSPKPALIIAIPVGFIGANESKDYLWRNHNDLQIECITIDGHLGGSALTAGAFNTLIRLQRGLRF